MKHLGDITRLKGAEIEPVDVITGGSPCQDLSLAGKQAGLSGDRSGLFHEQMRVVREMREATCGLSPRFMVWENVPGALSTNKGADFREVLNECVKVVEKAAPDVPMPEKGGWPKAGVLYDELGRWSIAWRIHDAQFWGVPQRRRRIALVCDFRGRRAPEILFEREGVRGDTAPCGAAGQGAASYPGRGAAKADAGRLIYQLVGVNSNSMRSSNPHSGCYETEAAGALTASGCEPNNQGGTCIVERHAVAYKTAGVYDACGHGDGKTCATLVGDHDSRITDYTNVVCVGANVSERGNGVSLLDERAHTLKTTTQESVLTFGMDYTATRAESKHRPVIMPDVSPTLIAEGPGGVCAPEVFVTNGALSRFGEDTVSCLTACEHKGVNNQNNIVARTPRYAVRRLTPLECTRLQGYPDGWVDIGDWTDTKGRARKDADTTKYKALGNSIALPFWRWLLARIYAECEAESFDPALGSLFDGIGGFPLSWPGRTAWSSEIDEFPLAVLRARFGED